MKRRTLLQAGAAAAWPLVHAGAARAEAGYPSKPVRILVPYTTGQSADLFGRMVAIELGKLWPQQVFIDNKGGGASIPGMLAGRNAAPDGYTLTVGGSGPMAINPGLYGKKLPYDPLADFIPVHGLFLSPLVVLANPAAGIDSFRQLVESAKRKPGTEKWGVAGLGTSPHLAGELIKAKAQIDVVAVPYRGSGVMLSDLLGGQVTLGVDTVSAAISYVRSGQLKALAVTSAKRVPQLPDVPTVAESGFPGVEAVGWAGFLLPLHTPPAVVSAAEQGIHRVMSDPAIQEAMTQRGALPDLRGGGAFGAFVKAEVPKWTELIVANGIKVDQ
ncbi:Bug family tripartite tricarboxylate transporter substrate binding protein [Variovorax sp.]|jgi:tripartite-type tricarboxylate transporter receptor subunit TctC|uniref:Bug family tripartite tricarboxylate transporter substrate binding protein n=1 Tax=Variovorax sp. TaxID=1871043 RepID=UPI0037D9FCA3